MIEQIQELQGSLPFSYEQRGSVIVSSSAIVTDLLFMEEINALVIKDFSVFQEGLTPVRTQSFFDSQDGDDEGTLEGYGFNKDFTEILLGLAREIDTSLLGVQITSPQKEMCPSFHADKLPLRIVQCFNSEGPTLKTTILVKSLKLKRMILCFSKEKCGALTMAVSFIARLKLKKLGKSFELIS